MIPMSRPIRVIASCVTLAQVSSAQMYAFRWCALHGFPAGSAHARFLFSLAHAKVLSLAHASVRAVGAEALEPAFQHDAGGRERQERGKEAEEY